MANPYKQAQKDKKSDELMKRCKTLLSQGQRVEAVKLYRAESRVGLDEARRALGI